jgi:hypothetical protein
VPAYGFSSDRNGGANFAEQTHPGRAGRSDRSNKSSPAKARDATMPQHGPSVEQSRQSSQIDKRHGALLGNDMVKWATSDADVVHYAKIAQQSLKAMTSMSGLRPYFAVMLRDETIVRGWLERLTEGNNAHENARSIPTSWRGSIVLRNHDREMEIDFLDVETVRASKEPGFLVNNSATLYASPA